MRNRAKCRLCQDIIESFTLNDYVSCFCGEIAIDGGNIRYSASAKDWRNFLRVDDNGNEIEVKVEEKAPINEIVVHSPIDKNELIQMLDEMRKRYEDLPSHALFQPVTHADFASLLMLVTAIFKENK